MTLITRFKDLSLRMKLIVSYSILFIVIMMVGNTWVFRSVSNNITHQIENNLETHTIQTVNLIQAATDSSVKNHLRTVAENNMNIVKYFYGCYTSGVLDEASAKKRATEVLSAQKIGTSGYNYVLNSSGELIIHPVVKNVGRNIYKYEFAQTQIFVKNGYLEYNWKNPNENTERAKALHMSYFEPWDWIITASSYREEFNELVEIEDFEDRIASLSFGETGYSYILNIEGKFLVHPKLKGKSIDDLGDVESREAIEMIINKKNGVVMYSWRNPDEEKTREKIAVIYYMPEYNWIIASSSYRDEIYSPLRNAKNQMSMVFMMTITAVIIFTIQLSRYITNPMTSIMNAFSEGTKGNLSFRLQEDRKDEVGELSQYYNHFVSSLETKQKELSVEMHERLEKERRIRNILETTNEGFIEIDLNLLVVDVNPAFCSLLNYDKTEIIGSHLKKLLDDTNLDRIKKNLVEKRYKGLKNNYELEVLCKDNSILYCLVSASPILDDADNITGSFAMISDISELKENIKAKELALCNLEELNQEQEAIIGQRTKDLKHSLDTLRKTQDNLVRVEKMSALSRIISGIAHEINTPVGNCLTTVTYLDREIDKLLKTYHRNQMHKKDFEEHLEEQKNGINIIISNLNKATELIMMFKGLSSEKEKGSKWDIEIRNLIDDVVLLFKDKIEEGNHKVEIECTSSLRITSYPYAISQTLTHLMSNAIKHGFEDVKNRKFKIAVTEDDTMVYFRISDNGKGISEENLKHLFDPFYKLQSSMNGVGIGLHIVYNTVVQTLKGTINYESCIDQGTNYEIILPKMTE